MSLLWGKLLNLEFINSILLSFGISGFIVACLGTIAYFMHKKTELKTNVSQDDELKESDIEGFDDEIIKQTNERIMQEFMISSSIETKSSILIGTVGLIFVVFFSTGWNFYSELLIKNIFLSLPLTLGLTFLAVSFMTAFAIIRPRIRMKLLNPRKANNSFFDFNLDITKHQIKRNLIENFEYIENEGSKDLTNLGKSYKLFIIGVILLVTPWFFNSFEGFFT